MTFVKHFSSPNEEYCPWCWNLRSTGHTNCQRPNNVWQKDKDIGMIRIKWGWFVAVIASAIGAGAAGTIAVIVWFTYNIGG